MYAGTTWAGILDEHFLCPGAGKSHIVVSGPVEEVIDWLIAREGLGELFQAADCGGLEVSGLQLERHYSLYKGICDVCRAVGCRPTFAREAAGKTRIGYVARNSVVSDGTNASGGFAIQRLYPVNHLVCLGKGEGAERITVHLFASAVGGVSRTQTLFGIDEVEQKYDFSTAEEADLIERGTEKLKELQKFIEVDVRAPDAGKYGIGDLFGVLDKVTGDGVFALVEQVDVVVDKAGKPRYSFVLGDAEFGVPQQQAASPASVFFGGGACMDIGKELR